MSITSSTNTFIIDEYFHCFCLITLSKEMKGPQVSTQSYKGIPTVRRIQVLVETRSLTVTTVRDRPPTQVLWSGSDCLQTPDT